MSQDVVYPVKTSKVGCLLQCISTTVYCIYIVPNRDMHQWLLLQFLVLLMMGAESLRNMQLLIETNTAQSCISLVLHILQACDARKLIIIIIIIMFLKGQVCFLFLDPQNEVGPSISSLVVQCSFILLVYIVVLVLVFYLCPSSVRVVATETQT